MASLKKISLGAFAAGEIPVPISHTYLDGSSSAINISTWTLLGFYIRFPDGTEEIKSITFETDGTDGKVRYDWEAADMTQLGKHTGLLWVADDPSTPATRLASDLFVWEVKDGPGPTPA